MFTVTGLCCEYKQNPIGIDVRKPRISWRIESDERAVVQSAYRIEVAVDREFGEIVWDSGQVASDESVHIELDGLQLESRTRYYFRVEAWNGNGESSGRPETAYWETGLLGNAEWQAQWIGAPLSLLPVDAEQSPLLRRSFEIEGAVRSARIYATALGLYELELNGVRVGDSYFTPGWTSYSHRLQYQTYDVTGLVREGGNAVGAWLGNGWYKGYLAWSGRKNIYGDRTALLLQLHVTLEDGRELAVVSDGSWKASAGPILMSELYHGETYDARLEQAGWSEPGFDDGGWEPAETIGHSKGILVAQENEPVRRIEEIRPVELITTPSGETVIDMGQNMVGWIRFSLQGEAGRQVRILHAEVLDQEGNFYIENLRGAKQTVTYTLKGGEKETFEPRFSFQGFRYIKLEGFTQPVNLDDFTGVVLHSDMKPTGDFRCSDPLVNQLQHNILWGLKGNFLDVPTDCPQRDERLGWTGDAQMFIRTASYLTNVAPFFTKWLRDLAADQNAEGGVPFVVPNVLGTEGKDNFPPPFSSSAWGDAAVICPWTIYLCYGDKRILEEQYDSMKAWVEYIRRQGDNEYLWNTGFHFGDWLALDSKPDSYLGATDNDYVSTAFYACSVSLLQKSAAIIGREDDAKEYADLHGRIVQAFTEEFVTPSGRLSVPTQTAQILALMFGLVEGAAKERAVAKLMKLLEENKIHLTTGFVGTPYLNHVLSGNGQNDMAYKLLLRQDYPSWLYQITKGATTIWEHWDGIREDGSFWSKDMNSFNHYAYGAIGDWLYRSVAGIDTDENRPGYKGMTIRPRPGEGLAWAEGTLDTMYGTVACRWERGQDGSMDVQVTIPPNTTAVIELPHASVEAVVESGAGLAEAAGISCVRATERGVRLTVGSGTYRFAYAPAGAKEQLSSH
ncbi:MAG TPA: family 78 glycoside hydrolase catalytic domain [Paenibacillus sp.]|uniref:family 78 glycoside hydrolase catalytic domain n=1 Tax=Paenibacillus sp. TaxID=58172 RepID=UPI002C4F66B4|nr:family 78 glycoside hydrolase catalytic domain [Paenibacillus sp.]HUC90595.1 family 78 glycoside hydrolase catalytic domain [Paenibacillus sp.]